ncbi:phosphoadenosine phosphosulfate reductase [Methanohalophilus levihalophilus]|uniref:phosphoadenosine phosphosulfate reductase domain-containing protein n=1 Tax=Methanohalophilus levihalophilus TaxID=1431282 RepID=UPI001AE58B01|nr:phosphoadenosine phosphosulfate reductase family protein [Methanohalophilus levihalophilus]MBP2030940.1 phosphoadenosine phosphosulfate reductase [Methanohalophilus levihalophilus]
MAKQPKRSSFSLVSASSKPSGSSHGRKMQKKSSHSRKSGEKSGNVIYWCKTCNVPLIGKKCHICEGFGDEVPLGQPGDVRFCSPYERDVLSDLLLRDYNCSPFWKRVILLNKVPGDDRNDEVIVDGYRVGFLYFDLLENDYFFEPTPEGASIISNFTTKRYVELHPTKKRVGGKKLRLEAIDSYSDDFRKNSPVLLFMGSKVGVGIALEDPEKFETSTSHVLKVKGFVKGKLELNRKIPSMEKVIQANFPDLEKIESEAIRDIRDVAGKEKYRKLPVTVSFSGGKDSLVALSLAMDALSTKRLEAFFVNTGLEFPETEKFVHDFCNQYGISLTEEKAEGAFWENVDKFGPPGKDFRWCCKVCKLGPANAVMKKCGQKNELCLTIDGKRKYESFSRSKTKATEMNPFVQGQLNIFPLRNWRAFEVWLYIYWKKLPYNPLYDMGFERVGCYLCPSSLASEFKRLKELHPDLYSRWYNHLLEWAKSKGLSDSYIDYGFWRWKELPAKMQLLAEKMTMSTSADEVGNEFSIDIASGYSPCKDGSYSMELAVSGVSLHEAASVLKVLGDVVFAGELGIGLLKTKDATLKFFRSGNVKITGRSKKDVEKLYYRATKQLLRIAKCTGCGVCIHACPVDAIAVGKDGKIELGDSCTHCGKCTDSCVVIRYSRESFPDPGNI